MNEKDLAWSSVKMPLNEEHYRKRYEKNFPKKSFWGSQKYYDIFYTCNKTGDIQFKRVHRFFSKFLIFIYTLTFSLMICFGGLFYYFFQQYEGLKKQDTGQENMQSELAALKSKLNGIHDTLKEIEYFKSKIQQVTTRVDERKDTKIQNSLTKDQKLSLFGFGPLTEEEFQISQKLTSIKLGELNLSEFFKETIKSEVQSEENLSKLKQGLIFLQRKLKKMQIIPDLAPVRGRITSTFGFRTSPFTGKTKMHWGIDLAAPLGSPVYATANGRVVRVAKTEDYGNVLEIRHNAHLLTRYAHTKEVYVHLGDEIQKGEIVAAVGNTGHSTGPHVHYEIEAEGQKINPKSYIVLW